MAVLIIFVRAVLSWHVTGRWALHSLSTFRCVLYCIQTLYAFIFLYVESEESETFFPTLILFVFLRYVLRSKVESREPVSEDAARAEYTRPAARPRSRLLARRAPDLRGPKPQNSLQLGLWCHALELLGFVANPMFPFNLILPPMKRLCAFA